MAKNASRKLNHYTKKKSASSTLIPIVTVDTHLINTTTSRFENIALFDESVVRKTKHLFKSKKRDKSLPINNPIGVPPQTDQYFPAIIKSNFLDIDIHEVNTHLQNLSLHQLSTNITHLGKKKKKSKKMAAKTEISKKSISADSNQKTMTKKRRKATKLTAVTIPDKSLSIKGSDIMDTTLALYRSHKSTFDTHFTFTIAVPGARNLSYLGTEFIYRLSDEGLITVSDVSQLTLTWYGINKSNKIEKAMFADLDTVTAFKSKNRNCTLMLVISGEYDLTPQCKDIFTPLSSVNPSEVMALTTRIVGLEGDVSDMKSSLINITNILGNMSKNNSSADIASKEASVIRRHGWKLPPTQASASVSLEIISTESEPKTETKCDTATDVSKAKYVIIEICEPITNDPFKLVIIDCNGGGHCHSRSTAIALNALQLAPDLDLDMHKLEKISKDVCLCIKRGLAMGLGEDTLEQVRAALSIFTAEQISDAYDLLIKKGKYNDNVMDTFGFMCQVAVGHNLCVISSDGKPSVHAQQSLVFVDKPSIVQVYNSSALHYDCAVSKLLLISEKICVVCAISNKDTAIDQLMRCEQCGLFYCVGCVQLRLSLSDARVMNKYEVELVFCNQCSMSRGFTVEGVRQRSKIQKLE